MASLFEVDPDTNEVVYTEGEESGFNGDDVYTVDPQGSVLQYEAGSAEAIAEYQVVDLYTGDSGDSGLMVLSEDDLTALAINAPAAGSLNSSTIDYFDRLVDGLPADYVYVAYRYSEDDAYAGTIIYGEDYDTNADSIVFGEEAVQIDVSRVSGSSYSSYIQYEQMDASNCVVSVSQSGNVLYYTNAFEGYPILGSGARPFDVGPYIAVVIIAAFASAVLNKLLNRRRKHD